MPNARPGTRRQGQPTNLAPSTRVDGVEMQRPDDLLARAVALHDPSNGLAGVRELRAHLDRLEAMHVENALRGGWRWSDVAAALGLSKQAAHRKYAVVMRERLGRTGQSEPAGRIAVTDDTRLAVAFARQEAEALGCGSVGTEHILLGLTRLEDAPVAALLAALGATAQATRDAAAALSPRAVATAVTPRCRAALQGALREARAMGDDKVEPEHVLLALLDDPDAGAARTLERLGVLPDV